MLNTLQWMYKLHGPLDFNAIAITPFDTPNGVTQQICNAARAVFTVETHSYYCPKTTSWPLGPNIAWQSTARHMLGKSDPWLWLEADAIPIRANWLSKLNETYFARGKAFMGPIVPYMGHCNGVAIYPHDTAARCPKAMMATAQAWDYVMREEMIHDCHDASDLIFHFWGVFRDRPHPWNGNAPHFKSIEDIKRWIPPSTVLMHRCKDGSLTKRLNESLNLDRKLAARQAMARVLPA